MTTWRYEIPLLVLKIIFQRSKRNFISMCSHVISSMYYNIPMSSVSSCYNEMTKNISWLK